ncbi:hypothetical protein, partial [Lactobacillus gallinarum]|uniref:hypothetical protein n=1 Tax=Lactobacillus gallinarum TaxID=52242 RepID=UPI002432D5DD
NFFKIADLFLELRKIHCYTNSVDWEMYEFEIVVRFSYIFKYSGTEIDTDVVTKRPRERRER